MKMTIIHIIISLHQLSIFVTGKNLFILPASGCGSDAGGLGFLLLKFD